MTTDTAFPRWRSSVGRHDALTGTGPDMVAYVSSEWRPGETQESCVVGTLGWWGVTGLCHAVCSVGCGKAFKDDLGYFDPTHS